MSSEPSPPTGGVLSKGPFRRLFAALALSSLGDWLGFLATTALAAQLVDGFSGKAYATGGVLVLRLLPAVLLGPVAGAFVDRFDRRRTMVVCDLVRFALFVSIPLAGSLVWLLVASFLIETASLFWIPAKEASVPKLVGPTQLERANQVSLFATYGSAPVAAGIFAALGVLSRNVLEARPVDLALYVNAGTFLVSAAVIAGLRIDSPGEGRRDSGLTMLESIREGLAFARSSQLVKGLLVGMLGALAAGGAVIAQGQLFADTVLQGGQGAYGLLFGAVFVGIAGGIALGPLLIGDMSRRRVFGPSITGAGLSLIVLALVPNLAVAVLATVSVGAFAGLAYVVGLTLLGGEVDDAVRGRTFGLVQSLMRIDLFVVTGVTPFISGSIGMRTVDVGGMSLDVNGVSVTLVLGGVLALLVGRASLRQMDDRPGVPLRRDVMHRLARKPAQPSYAGCFLALEGGEGAGKSTQLRLLAAWLEEAGHEVVVTREPGATPMGRKVRALLLDPATGALAPRAEALLYAADRAQHVAQVVRPALERGAVVLTDRYVDSSLAYQGAGRALDRDDVQKISTWATEALRPDLTLLLDVDPSVGLARATRGGADRIEGESLAFHQRVRSGFLELAARDPERYLVVPAEAPVDVVHAAVRGRVAVVLPVRPAVAVP
ncbi:MAG: dTMP kinase [Mycobacteriales bacterium]|nr:dTMP kinase [Mycobacteriales bacterium]